MECTGTGAGAGIQLAAPARGRDDRKRHELARPRGRELRYLPQAKVYDRACALGPWIAVGATEKAIRSWTISLEIRRQGTVEFHGETPVARITRTFNSLGEWLFRSQTFAHGAVLLTGTGIVPPDDFTLEANDEVATAISGIGLLSNPVAVVCE